jgi:hypothetical protein
MPEHTDWEVVDGAGSDTRSRAANGMKAMLGPYWKWKVAALAVTGVALLVLLAMIAGIVVLAFTGAALLAIAVARIRKFFQQHAGPGKPPVKRPPPQE